MIKTIASALTLAALTASVQAKAATVYTCNGMGTDKGQTVTLTIVNSKHVKIDEDLADLDKNFQGRLNKDFSRFEYQQSEEGVSEVLVQSRLLEGEDKGMIKVQIRGEGFGSTSYYCHL